MKKSNPFDNLGFLSYNSDEKAYPQLCRDWLNGYRWYAVRFSENSRIEEARTRAEVITLPPMDFQSNHISFAEFIRGLIANAEGDRAATIAEFVGSLPSTPYIERDAFVHFLYCGEAESVTVPCDANDWDPSGFSMTRVDGTNFWYYTHPFEPDARLDYKFLLNGTTWILDPRNPHVCCGGFGPNSELRMPKYTPPAELEYHNEIPHGNLFEMGIRSEILDNFRTVYIYTPYNYDNSDQRFPLAVFHDGLDYLSLGSARNVLDYLIARKQIAPIIAVFVPPIDRNAEYSGTQMSGFHSFIIDELLPFVDRQFRTKQDPANRASIGASNGGNISLWLGLSYPEAFGNVAAQSSNVVSAVFNGYENSPRLNLKFYLDIGTYDQELLIPLVKKFVDLIRSKGYPYLYWRHHGGHSWGSWRMHLGKALKYFFPLAPNDGNHRNQRVRSQINQHQLHDQESFSLLPMEKRK